MFRWGLRGRILVSLILLMGVTFTLVTLAVLALTQRAMEQQAVRDAVRGVEAAAATMGAAVDPRTPPHASDNVANLARLAELFGAALAASEVGVHDHRGTLVVRWRDGDAEGSRPPAVEPPQPRDAGVARIAVAPPFGRHVRAAATIRDDAGRLVGEVHMVLSLQELRAAIQRSQQLMLLYILLDGLLVLVVGYVLLTRQLVLPLTLLTRATERVGDGEFPDPLRGAPATEIGELVRNFNAMTRRLADADHSLRRRVEELGETNARLATAQLEVVRAEKMATLGLLSAGIAHEVGNPLAAIVGLLELLDEPDLLDADEAADTRRRIRNEVERIDGIVRELLTFARSPDDNPAVADLRPAIETALRLCSHHPRSRGLRIVQELPPDSIQALHVEGRLVQVLLNLLVNAADASSGGGTVKLVVTEAPDGVTIAVEDTGPGVPPAMRERVFEAFYTTKAPGQGTGLGLAMCRRLVDAWGGRVWIESSTLGGARVAVWLPTVAPLSTPAYERPSKA